MYTSLYVLDYTAELIELTYDLGAATRKHVLPALCAVYVAFVMAFEFVQALAPPMRSQMIHDLLQEWEKILALDPSSREEESLEFLWYVSSLNNEELRKEWLAMRS